MGHSFSFDEDDSVVRYNYYAGSCSRSSGIALDNLCPIEGEVLTRLKAEMDCKMHLWPDVDYNTRMHQIEEEVSPFPSLGFIIMSS